MAQIPDIRRIQRQDMPGSPNWVDPLISPLNLFMEQTVAALSGNLNVQNIAMSLSNVTFSTPSNYSDGANNNFNAFTFAIPFNGASAVIVGSIDINSNNYSFSNKPVVLPVGGWRETSPGKITINYLTGLTASTSYKAIFLVF